MLFSSKIKLIIVLVFATAFTVSCSDEEEIFEQQEPETQISDQLKQDLVENSEDNENSEANEDFQKKVNWYETSSMPDSYCGVQAALLAYQLYDADNNPLGATLITGWSLQSDLSIEDVADQLEQAAIQDYGSDVQFIFVAGVLVKPIDENTFDVAQISNYATFSDYFDDCQSSKVTFEEESNTIQLDLLMPEPEEVDFPEDTTPCVTLDFPVDIIVADETDPSLTSQISVDQDTFIDYLLGNVAGSVFIDFVYPVTLTANNGDQITANTEAELQQILDQDCN